jgi:hypothetical protein
MTRFEQEPLSNFRRQVDDDLRVWAEQLGRRIRWRETIQIAWLVRRLRRELGL